MAELSACYEFASGDRLTICVEVENDYPDALAQAVVAVRDAMREALIVVGELDEDED